jgi:hypothetical protein
LAIKAHDRERGHILYSEIPASLGNCRSGVLLPLPVQNVMSKHVLSNVKERSFRFSISTILRVGHVTTQNVSFFIKKQKLKTASKKKIMW